MRTYKSSAGFSYYFVHIFLKSLTVLLKHTAKKQHNIALTNNKLNH